jgi:hypothetical protein
MTETDQLIQDVEQSRAALIPVGVRFAIPRQTPSHFAEGATAAVNSQTVLSRLVSNELTIAE